MRRACQSSVKPFAGAFADLALGNSVVAIGWLEGELRVHACGKLQAGYASSASVSLPLNYSGPFGGKGGRF